MLATVRNETNETIIWRTDMAVARKQIEQVYKALYDSIAEEVDEQDAIDRVLVRSLALLAKTDAYHWNKSFRDTVDRLWQYHSERAI